MAHQGRHDRLFCGAIFKAYAHNTGHQKYCAKPENQDYFSGPENVARVQK
jgi:hypothetical protein